MANAFQMIAHRSREHGRGELRKPYPVKVLLSLQSVLRAGDLVSKHSHFPVLLSIWPSRFSFMCEISKTAQHADHGIEIQGEILKAGLCHLPAYIRMKISSSCFVFRFVCHLKLFVI